MSRTTTLRKDEQERDACSFTTRAAMQVAGRVAETLARGFGEARARVDGDEPALTVAQRHIDLLRVPIPAAEPAAELDAAGADAWWDNEADVLRTRLEHAVQEGARLAGLATVPKLLGRDAELAAGLVRKNRPFITVRLLGDLKRWLGNGTDYTLCVSILVYADGALSAALVTRNTAMAGSYGGFWRLVGGSQAAATTGGPGAVGAGWQRDTKEAWLPQQSRQALIPADTERTLGRKVLPAVEPLYAQVGGAGIADTVIGGAVPAGLHLRAHAYDSAAVLLASAAGFKVRPVEVGKDARGRGAGRDAAWCSWMTTDRLLKVLAAHRKLPTLLIGRTELDIVRLQTMLE